MPDLPAVPDPASLADRVGHVFEGRSGALAGQFEAFEARQGQRRLAEAVARTLDAGGVLVAEAGTGTGKTLAYLVPAVLAGRRVLISTGTRTLQDQVFYKDVPAVARALGRDVAAAYMKGRTNYLCRHRFGRVAEAEAGLDATDRQWLAEITEWAAATTTGDRAEIEDLPDDAPLWQEVTATSEQCLGRDCPEFDSCFVTRMRDRAATAELVIVNHHLLCADAAVRQGQFGEVIPACDLLVIDEAHQLEEVVTQYFGIALGTHGLDEFVRDALRTAGQLADDPERAVGLGSAIASLQLAGRLLFDGVRLAARARSAGDRQRLTPELCEELTPARDELARALRGVAAAAEAGRDRTDDLQALAARARAIGDDLATLFAADDPRYVHLVEIRGRGVLLRAAPIDASSIIREAIVGGRHAAVLTSATLAVGSDFAYALTRFGTPDAETLQLDSEFDFASQALLYLPDEMPDPRAADFNAAAADQVHELLACTQGRAFVLFTSHAALREVHARLIDRDLPWPLLAQGTAPRTALLRDFRATPHAVLLATASFWQGVDVAGDALSCVIVDRLPFASPGDPIVSARIAAVAERGGHPFHEYQVPQATLALLQGLGRLIRTRSDRGVMAVLDPRLTRMAYGRRFLASLPPARATRRLDDVRAFFRSATGVGIGRNRV